jgi:hypothetical protein
MLNIISKSLLDNNINGPQKVVTNLIKGLDILEYPYCINKKLDATSQLWIHDDTNAIKQASKQKLNAIIGPNLYILPRNIPLNINLSTFVYIHPSKWATDFWKDFGFNKCKLDYWPTGIDTNMFFKRKNPKNGNVLIYFKERFQDELDYVKKILEEKKINYNIIIYGSYKQENYLKILKNTKYIIWIGRQESQGIALEEALSMNIPILVWDVVSIGHCNFKSDSDLIFNKEELNYTKTTSAYYFDNRCGIKIKNKIDLPKSITEMNIKWNNFEPRQYIIENLNLKKQAKDFIELFNKHYKISYNDGKNEIIKSKKSWGNSRPLVKMFISTKKTIKKIIPNFIKKYLWKI